MSTTRTPVLLVIRDGWGKNPDPAQNQYTAVALSRKPCDDMLQATSPVALLAASGLDVGVPVGVMGNSEVGHQNIGAGRIVNQEIVRITKAISDGEIEANPVWNAAIQRVKQKGSKLHFMGLCSDGGVHALLEHLYGFLALAKKAGVTKDVYVHAFMDGRDTAPQGGLGFMKELQGKLTEIGVGQVATVCGRFWSMDRDNRWERVSKAYFMLAGQKADATATDPISAIQQYYDKPLSETQKGDEFVSPTWIIGADGKPLATFADGDAVIFFNFRGDRPREIARAIADENFKDFERGPKIDLFFAGLTEYQKGLPIETILKKPAKMVNILGDWVAKQGKTQFRTAETEKYPHVTFFFNDYREEPFTGEDRGMASSPKVSTYDLAPDMSAASVTVIAREAILSGKYDLVVVNFANPDMVGHTGSIPAAVRACEATDLGVGVLLQAIDQTHGRALILADHGNVEQLWDFPNNCPHTSHTLNLVECFAYGKGFTKQATQMKQGGRLADVAPTVLALMGLPKPAEMTGDNLVLNMPV